MLLKWAEAPASFHPDSPAPWWLEEEEQPSGGHEGKGSPVSLYSKRRKFKRQLPCPGWWLVPHLLRSQGQSGSPAEAGKGSQVSWLLAS